MAGENAEWFMSGLTFESIARNNAASGLLPMPSARGRLGEGAVLHFRSPKAHREELLSDGRWLLFQVHHFGNGEVVIISSDITDDKKRAMDMKSMNSDLEELVRDRTRVLVQKASELKQANQRLRELDELKSSFLSSVSHELRTPLTSLLGFSKSSSVISIRILSVWLTVPSENVWENGFRTTLISSAAKESA